MGWQKVKVRIFNPNEAVFTPLFPEPPVFSADIVFSPAAGGWLVRQRAEPRRVGRPRTDPALIDKLSRKLRLLWRMRARTPKRPMVKDGANLVREMLARHHRRRGAKPIKLGTKKIDTIASSARDQLAG